MTKAIFFDIDGTLVSFRTHRVPASTVKALEALRAKGIKLFVATGRQLQAINNLGTLQFDGYVTLNGSICIAGRKQILYKRAIPAEDIHALVHYQQTVEAYPCALVLERETYLNFKNETVEEVFRLLNFPEPPLRPLAELQDEAIYQLIAFFPAGHEEQAMAALPHCQATSWSPLFADVTPRGGNKAIGIDKILAHFGIALEETMAFGDGGNDIPMLRHAGIGVAMGNADETVKNAADYVTDAVDDNGIWNALQHFGIL